MSYSQHDDDRRPRFGDLTHHLASTGNNGTTSPSPNGHTPHQAQRAASQPPRSSPPANTGGNGNGGGYLSSPSQGHFIPSSLGSSSSNAWSSTGTRNILTRTASSTSSGTANPGSIPIRSSSFSSSPSFGSLLRDRPLSRFPSTFEDDELSEASDTYDDRFLPPSQNQTRGRTYGLDGASRSRSQSLATTGIGMRVVGGGGAGGYLGNDGPTPTMSWNESYLNSQGLGGERERAAAAESHTQTIDASNMSPFVRDVGQILLDDGSAFRELWAGMHPPRDHDASGTTSGTTSRRHSVSVVQPRRGTVVGFDAPDSHSQWSGGNSSGGFGRGGLMLSDDDLASDLGGLSLDTPSSQPSSLPIYPRDSIGNANQQQQQQGSPYQSLLAGNYGSLRRGSTPNEYDEGGGGYVRARAPSYSGGGVGSPISPSNMRGPISPGGLPSQGQQPPFYLGRRPSLSLPAVVRVPPNWPLYIVEFKAGRTDLFYTTDSQLANILHVGDLVIVEADRGKDLGKVVNDSISVAEVEAWMRKQQSASQSPSGQERKKEINPKMIYSKATHQDTQLLAMKNQDEAKALQLCQSKVRAKKLPMEVVDAEYQWDRRKLTFYFVAEKRIDFRELVRELFRLYKTRIWMASLQGGGGYEQ
ncbi:PSP1 C-terminal conserved region-domain-containing protein [Cyathus striatus]|nr:PSP1 C-terminal conserved region-domain-containing protein [Cyathus striatus]